MKKTLLYIMCMVLATINLQAQKTESSNGWDEYEIAKRTDATPLVNKSFLKGNLTEQQKELALATPYVDSSLKVYDVAHLLSTEEYNNIQKRAKTFVARNNIDMVIVTINRNNKLPSNDNNATENYAMDFYEYNDFGKGEASIHGYDGVILIIDMQNRKFCIFDIGEPNEKYKIASTHVNKYIKNMATFLTAEEYSAAIKYFINAYESDLNAAKTFYDNNSKYSNFKNIIGGWGTKTADNGLYFLFYPNGGIITNGDNIKVQIASWRMKNNNIIEFEVTNGETSLFMPWNIIELSDDNLKLDSGNAQIDLVRLEN
ncbi:MAG: TPM domain-containing protein [Bacteroidales bacterium]|nr:TPM domain-containing protein [Bacteroidales bacterium]